MGRPVRLAAALVGAAVLAGCASRPPAPREGPEGRDGPAANPPPNLAQVPDAVPRIEPLRVGGPNKPYEMLGQRYVPLTGDVPLTETGLASWYGRKFHGLPTSNGETYDMYAMTAAHKTMPIPSYARVRNPANGREVIVRINDRGPFAPGRVIDLSYTAALKLGVLSGVAPVQVQRLTFDDIRALARRAPLPADDPAPGDAPPTAAGWWLQVGAYRVREVATMAQERLLRDTALALPGVAVFEENGWFRVQAGPYASREGALLGGEQLQRRTGNAALVVQRGGATGPGP
jgi:rare lipoprotein A